jgi:peptide/nickel transport system substrate-binding protein
LDDLFRDPLRPQHPRPAEALIRRSLLVVGAALAAASALPGCGGDDADSVQVAVDQTTGSALVSWALAERPRTIDPLYASSDADRLAARQIYEPLVEELGAPYGDARRFGGPALSVDPSAGEAVWRVRLRPGIRFQDGTPLDAAAVIANAERWLATPAGRALFGSAAVDGPAEDLVRFTLPAPDPGFDQALAAPALGLVSPQALADAGGGELAPSEAAAGGTGPYELRERSADRMLLARNTAWWGSAHGLGPAVDQLELLAIASPGERLAGLRDGSVQIAAGLRPSELREVRSDPLLSIVPEPGSGALAVERSVRGIPAGDATPSLNALWLTRLAD